VLCRGERGRLDLDSKNDADVATLVSAPVRASLREAADRFVRHPAYRRPKAWAGVHNTFAMALGLADEHERAAEQFQIIGDVRTEFPWAYFGPSSAGRKFAMLREWSYSNAGVKSGRN
jgi:hypothetical protein